MNNLKQIRELYGATQEQIASAINVNRVTVANWEKGNIASRANQERLSIYFGIGPEYFYEKELDETARQIIMHTSTKAQKITAESGGEKNKEDTFRQLFEDFTFQDAMDYYVLSMKLLLATADSGELSKLKTASLINKKMGTRLNAIIELREKEVALDEPSLFDLLEKGR